MEMSELERNKVVAEVWMPLIERAIKYYRIPQYYCEDFRQTVLCQVLEKYYGIYDASKSRLNTFVFAMIRKRKMSLLSKRGKDALKSATRVGDSDWLFDCVPFDSPLDFQTRKEFWELVQSVRTELAKLPPRRPQKLEDGIKERTVLDVFDFLAAGLSQADIASRMGYSEASVSILVSKIRHHPAVQGLYAYYHEEEVVV